MWLTNEGDDSGAVSEFQIEDLRVGGVLDRGHQLVGFDEFMTSARERLLTAQCWLGLRRTHLRRNGYDASLSLSLDCRARI